MRSVYSSLEDAMKLKLGPFSYRQTDLEACFLPQFDGAVLKLPHGGLLVLPTEVRLVAVLGNGGHEVLVHQPRVTMATGGGGQH